MGDPVVHFEIGGRDQERSREFYGGVFDWRFEPYGESSSRVATGSDRGVQGHLNSLGHEPHSYVICYVEVDDIAERLARVEEYGGTVSVPETGIPGGGRFAWIKDPDGNLVGLLRPE